MYSPSFSSENELYAIMDRDVDAKPRYVNKLPCVTIILPTFRILRSFLEQALPRVDMQVQN